jgi:hypothetical protein
LAWNSFIEKESWITNMWLVPLCQGKNEECQEKNLGFARDEGTRFELSYAHLHVAQE